MNRATAEAQNWAERISAEDEGIFLGGSCDASGNTVLNAAGALITSGGVGVDLYSYNNTTANTVTNAGQISAEDTGIYLGATNDLSGNTVVNEESPDKEFNFAD